MRIYQLLMLIPFSWICYHTSQAQQSESKAAAAIRHIKETTRAGLDSLDREQEKIDGDAIHLKKEAIADYKKEITDIRRSEVKLRRRVREESKIADEKWESFKTSVEKDFHTIKQRVEHLREKVKKGLPDNDQQGPPSENNSAPTTLLT
ncbi:hypothetical protein [Chitinophaga qingshengii]|uniref:Uncharacterized protein n=1 Tax=Chitinophaga qingshengii TaxID=1569794 RepID=A0ABR7TIT2_9BACT|nr:hypothetical protein [Chitinophaga qingshengii]MBC9929426.1 hypothetical protein [Chitinophaga qingshengii]